MASPIRSINGDTGIRAPSKYSLKSQAVHSENSGRGMNGTAWIEIIAKKVRIDVEWNGVPMAEGQKILSLTAGNFFAVEYLSEDGIMKTKQFYRSDVETSLQEGNTAYWSSIKFGMIER